MKLSLLIVCLLLINSINAQIIDNFSDGNFHSDPTWSGDTSKFIINQNLQLQLNNSAVADEAYLSFPASIADSTIWTFYVKMTFSPSATNFMKIYLQADQQSLKSPLNGYFIKIGENGSNDAINLYEQSGTTEKLIAQGIKGRAAVNPTFSIQVIRDAAGTWTIFSDSTGGTNYIMEGTGFSDKFKSGSYFGIFCKHTSTNAKKFFFDDLNIGPIYIDTLPPIIAAVNVIGNNQLEIFFNEKLEKISAETAANYFVHPYNENPQVVLHDTADLKKVRLIFSTPFISKTTSKIIITNISDEARNIMIADSTEFYFYAPAYKDVVINEIMADPSPPVDLPEVEYVEFYNNSNVAINLKGWKFSDGTSTAILPEIIIPADSFLILVSNANLHIYSNFGLTAGVSSLPSLNNSGDELMLSDPEGNVIHKVNYTDKWYRDTKKKEGGWSLELIDANNDCDEASNWIASIDLSGGTPGRRNSASALKDTIALAVVAVLATSDSVTITFTRSFVKSSATDVSNYHIEKGIGSPVIVSISDENKVVLKFIQQFETRIEYKLSIKNLFDCNGNAIDSLKPHSFSLPEKATFFDIVINEIMADPDPAVGLPAFEYVELYNRSNKTINLKHWKLSDGKEATLPDIILLPENYLILVAAGKEDQFKSYGKVTGISNWPALNNDGEFLTLIDDTGNIIHFINYSDSWYGNKIKKDGGWSLEQIDPENYCGTAENWSASKDIKGGTPGKRNSIFNKNPDNRLPELISAYAIDKMTVVAVFNESVHPASVMPHSFHIKKGIGNPVEAKIYNNDFKKVTIKLAQPLSVKEIYDLEVNIITDCAGNKIGEKTIIKFGLPEPASPMDIIINEILYNPEKGGVDFVEIYNNSNKIINLQDLIIARTTAEGEVTDYTSISSEPFLILPAEYFALTSDPEMIKRQYFSTEPSKIISVPKLPNYLDDEGGVAVLNKFTETIDFVYYNSSWQHPFIDDHNGISLERIDFNGNSFDKNNWHSASTKVKATPAYKNSQFSITAKASTAKFTAEPEVFSPDGDGYNDFLKINYQFEEPGNIVSISVYDSKGAFIRQIIKNEMLEQQGFLIWDGLKQDQQKTAIGIYIILIESYNQKGEAFSTKIRCVVGGML